MKKINLKKIDNEDIKLIGNILLTFILIFIAIVLFEDVGLDNSMLIYNIYGTLALVSFLYSYHSSNKKLYNDVSFGITRKEFFFSYLKNIGLVLGLSLIFVIYYMIIFKLIIVNNHSILKTFNLQKIICLPLVFLGLSFLGFLLGILKMRKQFFYTLVSILSTLIVLGVTYIGIKYYFNIMLGVVVIGLGIIDFLLIDKVNI